MGFLLKVQTLARFFYPEPHEVHLTAQILPLAGVVWRTLVREAAFLNFAKIIALSAFCSVGNPIFHCFTLKLCLSIIQALPWLCRLAAQWKARWHFGLCEVFSGSTPLHPVLAPLKIFPKHRFFFSFLFKDIFTLTCLNLFCSSGCHLALLLGGCNSSYLSIWEQNFSKASK